MRGRRATGRGRVGITRRSGGVTTIVDGEVNKEVVVAEEVSIMMVGSVVGGGNKADIISGRTGLVRPGFSVSLAEAL